MAAPPRPMIASSFVRKLYSILNDDHGSIISWDETGTTFSVFDIELLVQRVLPLYFRGRLDAFRQQLREHGFQHVASAQHGPVETYRHPHFVRGNPDKLSHIVRTPLPRKRDRRVKSTKEKRPSMERLSSSSMDLSSSMDSVVSSETHSQDGMLLSDDEKSYIFDWLEPTDDNAQPSPRARTDTLDFVQVDLSEVPPNDSINYGDQTHTANVSASELPPVQSQRRVRPRYSQLSVDMLEMLMDFFSMAPSEEAPASSTVPTCDLPDERAP